MTNLELKCRKCNSAYSIGIVIPESRSELLYSDYRFKVIFTCACDGYFRDEVSDDKLYSYLIEHFIDLDTTTLNVLYNTIKSKATDSSHLI